MLLQFATQAQHYLWQSEGGVIIMILESNKNNIMFDSRYKVLIHLTVHASWVSWNTTSHSSYQCMIEHGCNSICVVLWFFSSQLSYFSDRECACCQCMIGISVGWERINSAFSHLVFTYHIYLKGSLKLKMSTCVSRLRSNSVKICIQYFLSDQALCFSSVQLLWNKLQGKYIHTI